MFTTSEKGIYICFIDYQKAFDMLQHDKLLNELQKIKLDEKDISITQNLCWNQEGTLKYSGNTSNNIHIQRGVRQSCEVLDDVEICIKINGKYITNIGIQTITY